MNLITVNFQYFDEFGNTVTNVIHDKTFKSAMKKIDSVHRLFLNKVSYTNKRGKHITIWFENGKRIRRVWE